MKLCYLVSNKRASSKPKEQDNKAQKPSSPKKEVPPALLRPKRK